MFFYSDISGRWLWNLEGLYSLVLEGNNGNKKVPYKQGKNDLQCHVLFVSDLIQLN